MKTFLHSFRLTFGRFRWEILAFWILSLGLVLGLVTGFIPHAVSFQTGRPVSIPPDFAKLEILAACWITLRLMFSEPIFLTQGGWRTRPIPRPVAWATPFAVLLAALLPSLMVRIIFIAHSVSPDARQWWRIFRDGLLWGVLYFALAAVILRLAGGTLFRPKPGLGRKIGLALVGLLAMGVWFHPKTARMLQGYGYPIGRNQPGDRSYGDLLPGLRELLPQDARLIATGGAPYLDQVPRMQELIRFIPIEGTVARGPGITVEVKRVRPAGGELEIEMEILALDPQIAQGASNGAMLLHYPGSTYSFRQHCLDQKETYPLSFFPFSKLTSSGSFAAPVWNPDWNELAPQVELIIYGQALEKPRINGYEKDLRFESDKPQAPKPALPPGVAGDVTAVFNGFDNDPHWNKREPSRLKGETIPREGLPHVMARHPWSDLAWELFVKPFLLKHAVESDKQVLLERMTTEPRLGEIFIAKGWKADAMPLLKRFAKERLPLDLSSLTALAEEKDPALAADLGALAAKIEADVKDLEPLLRAYPGFDWKAFVHEGWVQRKYAFRRQFLVQPFDLWAAQLGDASALRYIAEKAARKETGYLESLRTLLAGEHEDLLGYLRENIGGMSFDAATGKWRR